MGPKQLKNAPPPADNPRPPQVKNESIVREPARASQPIPVSHAYFIIGCARSGTTSLCRILDQADNGVCLSEPNPTLDRESRDLMEGRLADPARAVTEGILPRVQPVLQRGEIYGEKNVTLGPFIPYLCAQLPCRFVYVKRDGRDVVRSLINWHNQMFGSIYRECADTTGLSKRAKAAVSKLPLELDGSDYARPRPGPEDMWFEQWEQFSRLEMTAWYWSRANEAILDALEAVPHEQWIAIDYTAPTVEDLVGVREFLGLTGISERAVQETLAAKLNSLDQRVGESGTWPAWLDWAPADRVRFDAIASRTMRRLGYYPAQNWERYKPPAYGSWWEQNPGGLDWYIWMYESRQPAHDSLLAFVAERESAGDRVHNILDVGCGCAVGYADAFRDRRYVGMDLSEKEVAWCREHRAHTDHDYICADVVADAPTEQFDLVFSQGTIDNTWDINAYLRGLVRYSRKWIVLTAYRGWFPDLPEHRYTMDPNTSIFYNDISPAETRVVLEALGCTDIRIEPLAMNSTEIPFETRIIARVSG